MIRNEIENKTFNLSLLNKVNEYYEKKLRDYTYYDRDTYNPVEEMKLFRDTIKMMHMAENYKENISTKTKV